MEDALTYGRGILQKLEAEAGRKKGKIVEMLKQYESLMQLTDNELRIHNANERVLGRDPVYFAAADAIQHAMRTRKATLEQYESAYETIYYLHCVPNDISPEKCGQARRTKQYLLDFCASYNLRGEDLDRLLEMRGTYHTNFFTLEGLVKEGLSSDAIEMLFAVREGLSDLAIYSKGEKEISCYYVPSIRHLRDLYKQFPEEFDEPHALVDLLYDIQKQGKTIQITSSGERVGEYMDTVIKRILKVASELGNEVTLETVRDYLRGEIGTRGRPGLPAFGDDFSEESFPGKEEERFPDPLAN